MNGEGDTEETHQAPKPTQIDVLRRRETKWLEMLSDWDGFMLKNYRKVRERCRKGIPASLRASAWTKLCGANYHLNHPEHKTEFKRLFVSRNTSIPI